MLSKGNILKKKSGILMPLSSLPSKDGIGTLGEYAYKFVDFLCDTKQKYWQLLPLVPLGECNSPYKSSSCFAGEMLYIDLSLLARDGLIPFSDLRDLGDTNKADFVAAYKYKMPLIKKAAENFDRQATDYQKFLSENDYWLDDFAVFMTALSVYGTDSLKFIPQFIKQRSGDDYEVFLQDNRKNIDFYKTAQYFFYSQYFCLLRYANEKGVMLIGDLPFYVSADSSDVWANRENFLVDEDLRPKLVAGVPPDYFSEKGQLWGNPIYDFEYLKSNDYEFIIKRIKHYLKMFNVIRIDHFRAFADYYVISADAPDATNGEWKTGAGMDFWQIASQKIPDMRIIAEDLGADSPLVRELVINTGFPNMKVMQFAFSGGYDNPHLPENYTENCVCYTGTHDNDTTLGFLNGANDWEKKMVNEFCPETEELKAPFNIIKAAMDSVADTVIIPMQDYLALGSEARMNVPGEAENNWEWRLTRESLTEELKNTVLKLARK